MEEVKPGVETTEYKAAKSSSLWGILAMILGFVVVSGAQVATAVGMAEDSMAGIIVGAILSVAGIIQKTLTDLGYIKSRTDVKVASQK